MFAPRVRTVFWEKPVNYAATYSTEEPEIIRTASCADSLSQF